MAFVCPQLSPEEEEKRRIRRERNKMAAAKCRNRRRELTDTLQAVSAAWRWGVVCGCGKSGGLQLGVMPALTDSPALSVGD